MKFNFKLKRLCGSYYGYHTSTTGSGSQQQLHGSNLVYDSTGNLLLSSVSNRIQILDLKSNTVQTLSVEARSSITQLALSPDDAILMVVDVDNYALLINFHRGIILHRFKFESKVRDIQFSPMNNNNNGGASYLAVSSGKQVQVWCTPSSTMIRQVSPLVLHRTYTGLADTVTCLTWSSDASVLVAGCNDGSFRIWTLQTTRDYTPMTCSGHKRGIVGVYFVPSASYPQDMIAAAAQQADDDDTDGAFCVCTLMSISEDGALVTWKCRQKKLTKSENDRSDNDDDDSDVQDVGRSTTKEVSQQSRKRPRTDSSRSAIGLLSAQLVGCVWKSHARHYLIHDGGNMPGAMVSAASYCSQSNLLAVGFTSGVFGLYELPSVSNLHTLSIGTGQLVRACTLNHTGEWLALGCPLSQQLLVWEWRSETYVIKQRGHAYGMRCMAYSPDGIVVATGGEDGKIKLWNATSGLCYVTLDQSTHTAPVTQIAFATPSVVVSASLDGTVKAHDLHRYRTFRTFTTPAPVQFLSLAVDPSGEIVTAGTTDPFHIYIWNLQTGKLMDVLTGHSGPICDLAFLSSGGAATASGMLASASWDGSVKLWDLYKSHIPTESLSHATDVVCVACRPDGKEVCTGTIGGLLSFWDVETAKLKFEIDGRRDIAGGRKVNDRMTADNNAASRYFTSICYSADGSCILAGGNSKYVCIYEVSQQMSLKKFQVTFNRSLDGVLDELNSKRLGDFGPMDNDPEGSEKEGTTGGGALHLPGARRSDDGSRSSKVEVLTHQVSFSSTGREWSAVSGEGLHVYAVDDDMLFDPIALTEDVTPASILHKLSVREYSSALHMALHLNEETLVRQVLEEIPYNSIPLTIRNNRFQDVELERLLQCVAKILEDTPHIEFYVQWCLQLLIAHGLHMDRRRSFFLRSLRSMRKSMLSRGEELRSVCNSNSYTLSVLYDHLQSAASNTAVTTSTD